MPHLILKFFSWIQWGIGGIIVYFLEKTSELDRRARCHPQLRSLRPLNANKVQERLESSGYSQMETFAAREDLCERLCIHEFKTSRMVLVKLRKFFHGICTGLLDALKHFSQLWVAFCTGI